MLFDDQKIDIPCPNCGREFSDTLDRLRTQPQRNCSACGEEFEINMKNADEKLRDIDKQLRAMGFKES